MAGYILSREMDLAAFLEINNRAKMNLRTMRRLSFQSATCSGGQKPPDIRTIKNTDQPPFLIPETDDNHI